MNIFSLNGTDWQFKACNSELELSIDFGIAKNWLPATVPGSVHQDLLAAGQILDPFQGVNEEEAKWIENLDWLYRYQFALPVDFLEENPYVELCFDGLDTFAIIYLNGEPLFRGDNMFISYRQEVRNILRPGENELKVLFKSALVQGQEREKIYGKQLFWLGDSSRLYVRKAQYHYGWDWGPRLITAGVWRGVRLEAFKARISEVDCPVELGEDLSWASIEVTITTEPEGAVNREGNSDNWQAGERTLELELFSPRNELVAEKILPLVGTVSRHTFEITTPQTWWPHGYGEQLLYQVVATLKQDDQELDRQYRRVGLRRLRLVQEPLQNASGSSFYFEVNNRPIFCGGANWIPADSFLPRLKASDYRRWLELAAEGNQVMLRVWGGGIYEDEAFYDSCDELGILVWQDFMFACGVYGVPDWFVESVQTEARQVVSRLRHHPCLALWCGNNEDYMIADRNKLYDPTFEGDFTQSAFPARHLYEEILPEICHKLNPQTPYWPGSPYGGRAVQDPTIGDRHSWEVWHEPVDDYHNYGKYQSRFISEFGMQSAPALETIASFTPVAERYSQSRTLNHHNKAADGVRRIEVYLDDNLRVPASLAEYVYATQFIQSEAISTAIRSWRGGWRGAGSYEVGGALVWQLNDCWPAISWALVDYYFRPKPAYYSLRRELAPVTISLVKRDTDHIAGPVYEIWGSNFLPEAVEGSLILRWFELDGKCVREEQHQVFLNASGVTEFNNIELAPGASSNTQLVVGVRLLQSDKVIARASLWPEPFKSLPLNDPGIEITRLDKDYVRVSSRKPAKGVWLSLAQVEKGERVKWSDNMLDLLPDDPQIIEVTNMDNQASFEVKSLMGTPLND